MGLSEYPDRLDFHDLARDDPPSPEAYAHIPQGRPDGLDVPSDHLTVKFNVPMRLQKDREAYLRFALAQAEVETMRMVDWLFAQGDQQDDPVAVPEASVQADLFETPTASPPPAYDECLSCQ